MPHLKKKPRGTCIAVSSVWVFLVIDQVTVTDVQVNMNSVINHCTQKNDFERRGGLSTARF